MSQQDDTGGGGMALRPLSEYTIPDDYVARFCGTPFRGEEEGNGQEIDDSKFGAPIDVPQDVLEQIEAGQLDVPDLYACNISQDLITVPAMLNGRTYELENIRRHLESKQTDPFTNKLCTVYDLHPNYDLRGAIEKWVMAK